MKIHLLGKLDDGIERKIETLFSNHKCMRNRRKKNHFRENSQKNSKKCTKR